MPHLRRVREMRALSQQELAKQAGVGRQTVMAIEGGRNAWPSTVRKLAKVLRVRPEELTGRTLAQ
jgi:DNA-binding XRE family transcriptional regulator